MLAVEHTAARRAMQPPSGRLRAVSRFCFGHKRPRWPDVKAYPRERERRSHLPGAKSLGIRQEHNASVGLGSVRLRRRRLPCSPRLTGPRKERLELLPEIKTGSRFACSSLREWCHFRLIERDQKLSVDAVAPSELARSDCGWGEDQVVRRPERKYAGAPIAFRQTSCQRRLLPRSSLGGRVWMSRSAAATSPRLMSTAIPALTLRAGERSRKCFRFTVRSLPASALAVNRFGRPASVVFIPRAVPVARRGTTVRCDDGKARRCRALRARAGNCRGRCRPLVLQASVLGAPDGECRDRPGVRGVLSEVPGASMSGPPHSSVLPVCTRS
jgi:hypothetical protein